MLGVISFLQTGLSVPRDGSAPCSGSSSPVVVLMFLHVSSDFEEDTGEDAELDEAEDAAMHTVAAVFPSSCAGSDGALWRKSCRCTC